MISIVCFCPQFKPLFAAVFMSHNVKTSMNPGSLKRRTFGLVLLSVCVMGCSAPWVKKDDKEAEFAKRTKDIKELMKSKDRPRIIGDIATITGLVPQQYESFGLVYKLPGTGGDTRPSQSRELVLRELKIREVENPNSVIASDSTAIVKLRANAPAGAVVGDRVDVIVEKSIDCEATDLRGGELMPTRLKDLVPIAGAIRESNVKAIAAGPLVTVPPSLNSTKQLDKEAAIILGGARIIEQSVVYIRMNDQLRHVVSTQSATESINRRFDIYDKNARVGIATAKTDRTIEIQIPTKYRTDISHFVDTVLSVGFMESDLDQKNRMEECRKKMASNTTAKNAALQLEAIGKDAIPILKEYLQNSDKEIRYYAAYALAYFDDPDCAPVLAELIRSEPAFRHTSFLALTVADHPSVDESLRSLLQDKDPEVCYGALRALRKKRSNDMVASGQLLDGLGRITEIASPHPMVAVSLSLEPEVAVFGGSIPVNLTSYYEVNPRLTMRNDNGLIRFAHFRPGEDDAISLAEPNLRSVLQAFYDVKATYSDVIIFLDKAEQEGWISAAVEFNPLPVAGRKYNRIAGTSETNSETPEVGSEVSTKSQYSWWDPRQLFVD